MPMSSVARNTRPFGRRHIPFRVRSASPPDSPPLGGVCDHALQGAYAHIGRHRSTRNRGRVKEEHVELSQDHNLRHDASGRRAGAGNRAAPGREGGDRRAARAARRGRDRGRLRGLLARRFRGRSRSRARRPARHRRLAVPREPRRTSTPRPRRSRTRRAHASTSSSPPAPFTWRRSFASSPTRSSRTRVLGRARACASVDEVEFSCEDATRSDPAVRRHRLPRRRRGRRDDDQPSRHRRLLLPAEYAAFIRRRTPPLPRARAGRALRPLPRRPRARGRELARSARRRRRSSSSAR